jgi:kynureninase
MQPTRNIVLSQEGNFSTDLYVAQGLETLLGPTRCKLKTVAAPELVQALDENVAVLFLTQVNFRNGDKHDIERLTSLAKARGVLVVWDLSHSVGVLPLKMDEWEVDFAVGCGYKYLNGGPGAPAFIYANKKHLAAIRQPIQGWMGHREPFTFDPEYKNAAGVAQFLSGTPTILSLAILDSALDIFTDITVVDINRKANALAELFLDLVKNDEDLHCLTLESKADSTLRGTQLAFSHAGAHGISRALNKAGVEVDFRNPDIVRFGFSPLFLRFEDIWRAMQILKGIVKEKTYLADEFSQRLNLT